MHSPPLCQAPASEIRPPKSVFPRGAIDSHAHVCGPAAQYPYAQDRIYTPPDASLEDYRSLLQLLGVDRAVLVQPSVYGTDNRALIDALNTDPDHLRGIAVLPLDSKIVKDSELEQLHAIGVRGLRCNLVDVADPSGSLTIQALTNLAQRIAPLGWHLELLIHVNEYPNLATLFAHFPVDLVFGHFGYCHAKHGIHNAGFQGMLSLMKEQRAWVKMTGPYRISAQSADAIKAGAIADLYADMRPFNDAVLAANPKQLVWGSDWPHVMVKNTMPHDADLCDLFGEWVSDNHLRQAILVNNPSMLYDFP